MGFLGSGLNSGINSLPSPRRQDLDRRRRTRSANRGGVNRSFGVMSTFYTMNRPPSRREPGLGTSPDRFDRALEILVDSLPVDLVFAFGFLPLGWVVSLLHRVPEEDFALGEA